MSGSIWLKKTGYVSAVVCFMVVLCACPVQAQQMSLNTPILSGASVTVTGTGSYPMSMVELFKNGVSQGCVQAAGDGTFAFPGIAVAPGDVFNVQQQQSWYFDTDGNLEGWVDNLGLDITVAGGILSATVLDAGFPALQNLAQTLNGPPTESLKVLEVRYRYTSAATSWNVGANVGSGLVWHPMNTSSVANFETSVWPLLGNHPGYTTGAGESVWWMGFAFNVTGAAIGDLVEIDYIRLREYIDYHFDNDGDPMNWVVNLNFPGGITVQDGYLSGTTAGDGGGNPDRIATFHPWANIDTTVYTVAEVRTLDENASVWGSQFSVNPLWYTLPQADPMVVDLTTNAGWTGSLANTMIWNQGGVPAGELVKVDYIRLRPATWYGPSGDATGEQAYAVNFDTDGTVGAAILGATRQTVVSGADCSEVTATAPANWHFVNWTNGGVEYSTDNPLTVTNVTAPLDLVANFAIDTFTVDFATDGTAGASLTGNTNQTVAFGADCASVEAVSPAGWHFLNWTLGGVEYSTDNPLTVTNVTADMSLVAVFEEDAVEYTVVFQTDGTVGASLVGSTTQTVAAGTDCASVEAVAPANWHFVNWTRGGSAYSTDNPLTVTNVSSNMILTANFAIDTNQVTFATDGTVGAGIVGTATQIVAYGADCTEVTATAAIGMYFVNWTVAGATAVYSTDNPLTVTNVTAPLDLVAHFADSFFDVTFEVDATGQTAGATISGATEQNVIYGGSCTAVEASVPEGYEFVHWLVNGVDVGLTDNPLTLDNVTENMTVIAVYTEEASVKDWTLY